ncbi:uncharacterized protein M421DRAFT_417696 [Didymella exigua CBS 183.55]|uniref:Uncharacterized protein n=1 Tax=Didymella exigua CBS 183.55 TaxID=1150837 RepID=A0A6A5RWM9_9PLEO|nr:uncharacterized protein M421DRAFT_417696 [Didymella exigua CBS 183.55]KAF1931969.1 hypothetical protein M421DRAFT_417696 [Didymella exigua CBS 183.55]
MSDSEQPSDAVILKKLQDVVISLYKAGNTDDLTVKRVRTRAEQALGLPDGLLKGADWKQKSQRAIMEAVDKYCGDEPEPGPMKPAPKTSNPKASTKKVEPKAESKQGAKRKAAAPKKQSQKRRKTASSEDELSDELSDAESAPAKKPARRTKNVVEAESDEEDEVPQKPTRKAKPVVEDEDDSDAEPAATPAKKAKTPPPADERDISESELSSLLDESPAKSKRQKKAPARKKKEPAKPKAKAAPMAADDPDTAETKRLQSWLVKCGIRKVWSKELAKFDTSNEKIRHLKGMLSDAGMDGRYSDEKAAKIKEKREFEKDLEAIQEGEASWGTAEDIGGRPRRRTAARAAPVPKIEFSDDDEESEEHNDDIDESSEDDQDDDEENSSKGASNDDSGEDDSE